MEENKNSEKNNHDHGDKCCGMFKGCCSGSKSKMMHLLLRIAIALAVFLIGLSVGSHFNRFEGRGMMYGSRFNNENYRGNINGSGRGGNCQFRDQTGACSLRNRQATPNYSNAPVTPANNATSSNTSIAPLQ